MTIDDREAIRELLYAYCQHVDGGAAEQWADLFTEDATFDRDGRVFAGRDALQRMAASFRADGLHYSTNEIIVVDGDGATVSSYVLVVDGAGGPSIRLAGRYTDRLRKVGERWRFASRRLDSSVRRAAP